MGVISEQISNKVQSPILSISNKNNYNAGQIPTRKKFLDQYLKPEKIFQVSYKSQRNISSSDTYIARRTIVNYVNFVTMGTFNMKLSEEQLF